MSKALNEPNVVRRIVQAAENFEELFLMPSEVRSLSGYLADLEAVREERLEED
ncbi:MAG: hypothetical protein ACXABY_01465 [Candidatus Thorarchaeota archaeon]|jgi:hypothetical protein